MPIPREKSKEDLAYKYLWEMICEEHRKIGDLLPTELEISKTLGINRLTVSKALAWLKNEGYISRRAGYGTKIERKPPSSDTRIILVISPWPEWEASRNWYYSRLLYAVHTEALTQGATIVNVAFNASNSKDEDFNRILHLYKAVKCEGAIVIDPYIATHERLRTFLERIDCPSVWIDSALKGERKSHRVDIDNFQAGFDLTERLISDGSKQIAFLSPSLSTTARQLRYEGYKAALEKYNMPIDLRYTLSPSSDLYTDEAGSECAGLYAARGLDADALFFTDYHMLLGVRRFCEQYPSPTLEKLTQLPIATFDYYENDSDPTVKYAAIQPIEAIGKQAVEVFLNEQDKDAVVVRKIPPSIQAFKN